MLRSMSDPNMVLDPCALLRRVVAAHDALEAARIEHGDDLAFTGPARAALEAALAEARRVVNAPQPWRREKRRRA
jgi:hypothetical protein